MVESSNASLHFSKEVMIHAFLLYSVCTIGKVSICPSFWEELGMMMLLFCLLITILLISYDSTKMGSISLSR